MTLDHNFLFSVTLTLLLGLGAPAQAQVCFSGAGCPAITNPVNGVALANITDVSVSYTAGNMYLGQGNGPSNTTGMNNTALGNTALHLTASGSNNTAVGAGAMINNTTGSNNTAMGQNAYQGGTGTANTALGANAGGGINGTSNTLVGYNAGSNLVNASGNIMIGNDTTGSSSGAANEINIGNTIYGTNSQAQGARFAGVNVPGPGTNWDVSGTMRTTSWTIINGAGLQPSAPLEVRGIVSATGLTITGGVSLTGLSTLTPTSDACLRGGPTATLVSSSAVSCGLSDPRAKNRITPLREVLPDLMQLDVVSYYFNADYYSPQNLAGGRQIGVLAYSTDTYRGVQDFWPELVSFNNPYRGLPSKSVDEKHFVFVVAKAVQEQQHQIDELRLHIGLPPAGRNTLWRRLQWLFSGS